MPSEVYQTLVNLSKQGDLLLEKIRIVSFISMDEFLAPGTNEKFIRILMSPPKNLEKASYYSKVAGFEIFFDHAQQITEHLEFIPQIFCELSQYTENLTSLLQSFISSQIPAETFLTAHRIGFMLLNCLTNLYKFQNMISNIDIINKLINSFFFAYSIYNDCEYTAKAKIIEVIFVLNSSPISLLMGLENYEPLFKPLILQAVKLLSTYKSFDSLKAVGIFSFYDNSRITLKPDLSDLKNLSKYNDYNNCANLELSIFLSILIFPSLLENEEIYEHINSTISCFRYLFVDSRFSVNTIDLLEKVYKEDKKRYSQKIKTLIKLKNNNLQNGFHSLNSILKYCDFQLEFITNLIEAAPLILTKINFKFLTFIKMIRHLITNSSVNLLFYSDALSKAKIVETLTIRLFKLISKIIYLEKLYIKTYGEISISYKPLIEKLKEFSCLKNLACLNNFKFSFKEDQATFLELEGKFVSSQLREVNNDYDKINSIFGVLRNIFDPKRTILDIFDFTYIIINVDLDSVFWSHCRVLNQTLLFGCFIGLYDKVSDNQFTLIPKGRKIMQKIQQPKISKIKEFFKDFISETIKRFLNNRYSLFYSSFTPFFYVSAMNANLPAVKGEAYMPPAGSESSFIHTHYVDDMRSIKSTLKEISSIFMMYPGPTIEEISKVIPSIIRTVLVQFATKIAYKKDTNTPQTVFETCQFLFYSLCSAPKEILAQNKVNILSSTFYEIVGCKPMSKEVRETMQTVNKSTKGSKSIEETAFKNAILEPYFSLIKENFVSSTFLYVEELKSFFTQTAKTNKKVVQDKIQLLSITNPTALQTLFRLLGPRSCEILEDTIVGIIHKVAQKMRQSMMSDKEAIMKLDSNKFSNLSYIKNSLPTANYKNIIDSLIQIGVLLKLKNILNVASLEVVNQRHPFHKNTIETAHQIAFKENIEQLKYTVEFSENIGLKFEFIDIKLFKKLEDSFVRSKEIMEIFEEAAILSILSLKWNDIVYHTGAQSFSNNVSCITSAVIAILSVKCMLKCGGEKVPDHIHEEMKEKLVRFVELAGDVFWAYGKDTECTKADKRKLGYLLMRMIKEFGVIKEIRTERFISGKLLLEFTDANLL